MKLKNKKTGEIIDADFNATISGRINIIIIQNGPEQLEYNSLAELNEEWEDYEEPKDIFWIDNEGTVCGPGIDYSGNLFKKNKEIGNYFDTKEEAEKAVEKLKAWERLKDKGFRFDGIEVFSEGLLEIDGVLPALERADNAEHLKIIDDLYLLFGGEE